MPPRIPRCRRLSPHPRRRSPRRQHRHPKLRPRHDNHLLPPDGFRRTQQRFSRFIHAPEALLNPVARRSFAWSLVGRFSYALLPLPLLFAVTGATDSLAIAGITVATFGGFVTAVAPFRARLLDHFGVPKVLPALVIACALTLITLGAVAVFAPSIPAFLILAALLGIVAPPLGPTMRVLWARISPTEPLLRKALSLDAAVEECMYLAGPALAGALLLVCPPGVLLMGIALLMAIGGLLFVRASPVALRVPIPARENITQRVPHRSLLRSPRFVAVLLPPLVAGALAGSIGVSVPALVAEQGGSGTAGLVLGVFAGGSALGGLVFGALRVPGNHHTQLIALSALMVLASSALSIATSPGAIAAVLGIAGLFFAPTLTVAFLSAHRLVPASRSHAATTWVNTGHNMGATVGTASAGVLMQGAGMPAAALSLCGASFVVLLTAALLGRPQASPTSG